LSALGAGPRVVGVDDFSDEPAAAQQLEKVGGIKVNFEKVVSLKPDLVLTVKFSDGTIEKLASAGLLVLVVDPQSAGDVARTAILLGRAVGSDGETMARDIQKRVDDVRSKTSAAASKPRVYHEIDASDPTKIFTVGPGSYIHDLIEIAGGQNIAARAASAYPQLSAEEILRSDPEIILLAAPGDVLSALLGADSTSGTIIRELRLPRVLGAALVGGALAAAGALLQGMLRNPLADPFVTGTSAGASLGAVLAVALGFEPALVP